MQLPLKNDHNDVNDIATPTHSLLFRIEVRVRRSEGQTQSDLLQQKSELGNTPRAISTCEFCRPTKYLVTYECFEKLVCP